jgi:hypothetical protein
VSAPVVSIPFRAQLRPTGVRRFLRFLATGKLDVEPEEDLAPSISSDVSERVLRYLNQPLAPIHCDPPRPPLVPVPASSVSPNVQRHRQVDGGQARLTPVMAAVGSVPVAPSGEPQPSFDLDAGEVVTPTPFTRPAGAPFALVDTVSAETVEQATKPRRAKAATAAKARAPRQAAAASKSAPKPGAPRAKAIVAAKPAPGPKSTRKPAAVTAETTPPAKPARKPKVTANPTPIRSRKSAPAAKPSPKPAAAAKRTTARRKPA